MPQHEKQERRRCYRVRYPSGSRPRLIVENRAFDVSELSEGGLRFHHKDPTPLTIGESVVGEIAFGDGARSAVVGVVQRHEDRWETVVADLEGISFERMIKEQRFLASRYLL